MIERGKKRLKHAVGNDFVVWWSPSVEVDEDWLPVIVRVDLVVDDGRLVIDELCTRRRQGDPPITIEVLKSMPLVRIARRAATDPGIFTGLMKVSREAGRTVSSPATIDELRALPEHEGTAVVYRLAFFLGESPTATVAEVFGLNRATAAKRVQAARRAGLLDPTTKGKKGA